VQAIVNDKTSEGKALCLAMMADEKATGNSGSGSSSYQMFAGGTDCVVKQFQM
jgi:hypothetical protein